MTARIEIGRLAAKDLGKWLTFEDGAAGYLSEVEHYRGSIPGRVRTRLVVGTLELINSSDTLIEVTGTNNKEQA